MLPFFIFLNVFLFTVDDDGQGFYVILLFDFRRFSRDRGWWGLQLRRIGSTMLQLRFTSLSVSFFFWVLLCVTIIQLTKCNFFVLFIAEVDFFSAI